MTVIKELFISAFATSGLTVNIQVLSEPLPTAIAVTGSTAAAPVVLTVASSTGIVVGSLLLVTGTGLVDIDGKYWLAESVTGTSVTLRDSDGTGGTAGTSGSIQPYDADNFASLCTATFDRQSEAAETIDVGTTCDENAELAGVTPPGNLAITGYVDYNSPGYLEFMTAVKDGNPRVLRVDLPQKGSLAGTTTPGAIIFPAAVANEFSEAFNVKAAASFTGGFLLQAAPEYRP